MIHRLKLIGFLCCNLGIWIWSDYLSSSWLLSCLYWICDSFLGFCFFLVWYNWPVVQQRDSTIVGSCISEGRNCGLGYGHERSRLSRHWETGDSPQANILPVVHAPDMASGGEEVHLTFWLPSSQVKCSWKGQSPCQGTLRCHKVKLKTWSLCCIGELWMLEILWA